MNKQQIANTLQRLFNVEITRSDRKLIVNEAVNFEKEVIFIAIPKTGTTSVRTQLMQFGRPIIPNPHLNIVQIRELIYIYLLKQNLGVNTKFPNDNMVFDSDLRKKSQQLFDSFFKFSAVRNPWSRTVSLYFRREGIQSKDRMSFDAFCENHIYASDTCRQPTLHINQYDWLASTEGDILMDYIYKVEEFDKAVTDIKEITNGRVILDSVRRNVNPNSESSDYRKLYNDKTKRIIGKHFEKDIDYFKYTF